MKPDQIFILLFGVFVIAIFCRSALGNRHEQIRSRCLRRLVDDVDRFAGDPEACRREIEMLTKSLAAEPEDVETWFQRGLYHQVLQRPEVACEDFSRAIELSPNDPYLLLCRGQVLIARGEADSGLADLDRALSISPAYADCRLLRATTLLQAGRFIEADKDLETILSRSDLDAESFLLRGELRLSLRFDYEGGARDAEAASDRGGPTAQALHLVGFCEQALGRKVEASEAFRQAASLHATTPVDLAYRGFARFSLNDVEPARRDFLAAREAGALDIYSRRFLGSLYLNLGEMDEALIDLNFVLSSAEATAEDHVLRATILSDRGDYRGAIADCEKAMLIDPNDGTAYNNLGWLLATCPDESIRNGPEALRLAQRACELMPAGFSFSKGTLAAAWAECGEFVQAIRYEEAARELTQGNERQDWEFLLDLYRSGRPYRTPLHDCRDRARKRLAAAVG